MNNYLPFAAMESLLRNICRQLNTANPDQARITTTNLRIAIIATIELSSKNLAYAKLLDELNVAMQERGYWKEGGKYYDFEPDEVEKAIKAIARLFNIQHLM